MAAADNLDLSEVEIEEIEVAAAPDKWDVGVFIVTLGLHVLNALL